MIADNTYFDSAGGTANWYKIRFYDGTNWSDYSAVMQGGEFRHYCSTEDVRALAGLVTADITDSQIYDIMSHSMAQLNYDIGVNIVRERIEYIDNTRENKIDGSNTTYYLTNWKGHFLGDLDNDGTVDTTDLEVYQVASDGTETNLTVSSVTANSCKFILASAPASGVSLYVTYSYTPVSVSDPHPLVKMATAVLTAAWAFAKINIGKAVESSFGNVRFARRLRGDITAFDEYYKKYLKIVEQITSKEVSKLKQSSGII